MPLRTPQGRGGGSPRARGQVLPEGSMAELVTGATFRGLRTVDICKEAKVEELNWSSYVAPPGTPRYNDKALRGEGQSPGAGQWEDGERPC